MTLEEIGLKKLNPNQVRHQYNVCAWYLSYYVELFCDVNVLNHLYLEIINNFRKDFL